VISGVTIEREVDVSTERIPRVGIEHKKDFNSSIDIVIGATDHGMGSHKAIASESTRVGAQAIVENGSKVQASALWARTSHSASKT
jgi:hypothetical protein